MYIYPAIDIIDGCAVRLTQGDFNQKTVFNHNPVEVAKSFKEQGAVNLHIIDLDAAKTGVGVNGDIIEEIIKQTGLSVQSGGGVRDSGAIAHRLSIGCHRVILGTRAVSDPTFIKETIAQFGDDKIIIGIDALNGFAAVSGWQSISKKPALDLAMEMKALGVKTIIYTDISKDGAQMGPNLPATKEMITQTGLDIIASGGVSNINDILALKAIGVYGIIIGKALYTGGLTLEQAIKEAI